MKSTPVLLIFGHPTKVLISIDSESFLNFLSVSNHSNITRLITSYEFPDEITFTMLSDYLYPVVLELTNFE
jgi:hypothetical protein